jgi:magnesium transporter
MAHYGAVLRSGAILEEGLGPEDIRRALEEPDTVAWLDLEGAAAEEIRGLEKTFGFHPLAVEDAQNPATRPKIEEYETFLFLVTRAVNHMPGEAALNLVPLFVFLNRRLIVTVHDFPMQSIATACDRLRKHPHVLAGGPDRLLHHVLDQVVDHYFPIVEAVEDRVEALEDEVFTRPGRDVLQRIFATRKELVVLRRSLGSLREVLTNLMSGMPYIDENLRPFFRDVHDHVLRILDEAETNRDILAGLLESYLSQINNRLSAVMKTLTGLTMIGLPFTVVSGFFGMNFEALPWIRRPWGVAAATGLMVAIAGGLYLVLRRRMWL